MLYLYFLIFHSSYEVMFLNLFVVIIKEEIAIFRWNSGALLSDLPAAFNSSLYIYDLVFAKLYKFELGMPSLKILHSYFAETRQCESK